MNYNLVLFTTYQKKKKLVLFTSAQYTSDKKREKKMKRFSLLCLLCASIIDFLFTYLVLLSSVDIYVYVHGRTWFLCYIICLHYYYYYYYFNNF
jgi:hypothetical protein